MAYESTKLSLASEAPLTGNGQSWVHEGASTGAQVQVSGYITDGGSRGLKVGDVVRHRNTATNIISQHVVVTVSATYPGAVDLSDTTTVASGTNTD